MGSDTLSMRHLPAPCTWGTPLAIIVLGALLAPAARAEQAAISIDGDLSDWSGISAAVVDSAGDAGPSGIDLGTLRIADDARFLFLQISLGSERQLDEWNDLVLYLDTDANAATGIAVAGIGAELEWRLGDRIGTFDPPAAAPSRSSTSRSASRARRPSPPRSTSSRSTARPCRAVASLSSSGAPCGSCSATRTGAAIASRTRPEA